MEKLDSSGLWRMLRDPEATASIEQADLTLGKFAIDLHSYCRSEEELEERYRSLIFFRSLITAPCEWAQGEAKCNGLPAYLSRVAANIIDGELDLAKLAMQFPRAFVRKKKVRTPLAGWNGTQSELLEMHTPLQELEKILKPNGEPMVFADIIDFLFDVYGVEISQPYGRKTDVLTRAKGGAPFIEKMLDAYLKKVEDKNK